MRVKSTDSGESNDTSEPIKRMTLQIQKKMRVHYLWEYVRLASSEGAAATDYISLTFCSGDSMSIGGLCNDLFGDVEFANSVMNFTYEFELGLLR